MVYLHKVQYYETDKMGVVHHSNYIRWFEEARTELLAHIGIPYDRLENEGIMSPVVAVECGYERPARFGDTVKIDVRLSEVGNVRITFDYVVYDSETGERRVAGKSRHCFTNMEGAPIALKRERPELFKLLLESAHR